ncbi:MAG: magnesium transporter CorA family protein [Candidatus Woesearchaeota archaeon]
MISCIKHDKKSARKCSLDSANFNSGTYWIDVNNPDKKELGKIVKTLKVSDRNLLDSLDIKEVPRVVLRKNYCFVILRALTKDKKSVPIGVFVGKNYIMTVHPKLISSLDKFFNICLSKEGHEFFSMGVAYLFNRVISEFIREFNGELEKISDKLNKVEDKILKGTAQDMSDLFSIKKQFMFMRRAIRANMSAINKLNEVDSKLIREGYENGISELIIEATQTEHLVGLYDEKLTGVFDMYMTSVSNKLNDIMRSFSVIASLLLLPMLISGIWGMNFANIPFFGQKYGFFIPIVLMLMSMMIMVVFFRKKKWI